jgi:hypothetical protein
MDKAMLDGGTNACVLRNYNIANLAVAVAEIKYLVNSGPRCHESKYFVTHELV